MSHIHASAMSALVTFAMVIIIGFFWRVLSMRYSETTLGKAMALVY